MDHIEQKILRIIEENADKIIAFGDDIWRHAEIGFMEYRTAEKFNEQMQALGFDMQTDIAITGTKAYLREKKPDEVQIALIGELDALPISKHPEAWSETGAVHACGHNAQLTGVMGAAIALADPEVREALGGNVVFMGMPSEEQSSMTPERKKEYREAGKLSYFGGKVEFMHLGAMDDIDLAVGHHIMGNGQEYGNANGPSWGFMDKDIVFKGRASHIGTANNGVDAQAAAVLAVTAINAQREGLPRFFSYNRHLVHSAIQSPAGAVNVVADEAKMTVNFRGMSMDALQDLSYRIGRAVKGAAIAMGAGYEIENVPGYMPYLTLKDGSIVDEVFEVMDPEHKHPLVHHAYTGCTDYGDLSQIMPVIQFYTGGHNGRPEHSTEFSVADPREYYLAPAKGFALLAYRLLKDNAKRAKEILAENPPAMTKEEYFKTVNSLGSTESMEMVPAPYYESLGL